MCPIIVTSQALLLHHCDFMHREQCSHFIVLFTAIDQKSVVGTRRIYIQTVSERMNFSWYADGRTLTITLCSLTQEVNDVTYLTNLELSKIFDWLAVNKFSQRWQDKIHDFSLPPKAIPTHEIPRLAINNTVVERFTVFNCLGLTINEFINSNSHS